MSGTDNNINQTIIAFTTSYVPRHEHEKTLRENESLIRENKNLISENKNFINENEKLISKLLSYETAHQQLNYIITANENTIEALRQENEQLKIRLTQLEIDNAELKVDNVQLKADNVQLKADNVQLKADNAKLNADNVQLKADIVELKVENMQLKADIVELKAEIVELKVENTQLKANVVELKADNIVLKADNIVFKDTIVQLNQRWKNVMFDKQSSKILCLVDDFNDTFDLQNTLSPPLDSTVNQNRKQRNRDCHFWLRHDSLDLSRYKMVSGLTKLKKLDDEFKDIFELEQGFPSGFLNNLVSELDNRINQTYNLLNIRPREKILADNWLNCFDI